MHVIVLIVYYSDLFINVSAHVQEYKNTLLCCSMFVSTFSVNFPCQLCIVSLYFVLSSMIGENKDIIMKQVVRYDQQITHILTWREAETAVYYKSHTYSKTGTCI